MIRGYVVAIVGASLIVASGLLYRSLTLATLAGFVLAIGVFLTYLDSRLPDWSKTSQTVEVLSKERMRVTVTKDPKTGVEVLRAQSE